MTEQEAISAITAWARQHFSEGDARLEVSVMHIESLMDSITNSHPKLWLKVRL